MYPFLRMAKEVMLARRAGPLPLGQAHVSRHLCWPWDLDLWVELNNGRTLTLMDLGRIPMFIRSGLTATIRRHGWGITVAGVSVRYRRRIRAFERFTLQSRILGWDERFLYVEHVIRKRGGEAATQALYRIAATCPEGILPAPRLAEAAGFGAQSPALPAWVRAWIEAEAVRPWPPEAGEAATTGS